MITRRQLLDLGFTPKAIRHRVRKGRLHPVWPEVYAVGRPELTQHGRWMAAVLTCGPRALLSHESAGTLWGIRPAASGRGRVDVSVPSPSDPRRRGIAVHRRRALEAATHRGIPVTGPADTLIDLATGLGGRQLERAINEADRLDLVHPEQLRAELDGARRPGARALRALLDRATFTLTDSDLEQLFVPIALKAGLPRPETQSRVNGFKVDFYWPVLKLVVETDGGRYHRTPIQQRRDRIRDQRHTAAGLTPLRFTYDQVRFEADYVAGILRRLSWNA